MSLILTLAQSAGLTQPRTRRVVAPATAARNVVSGGVGPIAVSPLNVGSIIGGIEGIIGGGGGVLPGIGDVITGIFGGGGGGSTPAPTGPTTTGTATGGCITIPGFGQWCGGVSAGPGSGFSAGTPPMSSGPQIPSGCAPRGYHPNKTGYWTAQGYVPKGTKMVRNRRRNPLNPRALSRSLSRITGFERATRSVEKRLAQVARRSAPRRSAPRRSSGCGCKK